MSEEQKDFSEAAFGEMLCRAIELRRSGEKIAHKTILDDTYTKLRDARELRSAPMTLNETRLNRTAKNIKYGEFVEVAGIKTERQSDGTYTHTPIPKKTAAK